MLVVAAVLITVSMTGYWMADSGVLNLGLVAPITPPAGAQAQGGKLVTITPIDQSIIYPQYPTQSAGYAIGRGTVSQGYASQSQLSFMWTDPNDAVNPLNYCSQTGNSSSCAGWIAFAIYYPIHTAACNSHDKEGTVATVTDGSSTYCTELDTASKGKLVGTGSVAGKVYVSRVMLGSYLTPGASEPSSGTCPGAPTSDRTSGSWCTPSSLTSQNIYYLIAQVILPGNNVPYGGQESPAGSMKFYLSVQ